MASVPSDSVVGSWEFRETASLPGIDPVFRDGDIVMLQEAGSVLLLSVDDRDGNAKLKDQPVEKDGPRAKLSGYAQRDIEFEVVRTRLPKARKLIVRIMSAGDSHHDPDEGGDGDPK